MMRMQSNDGHRIWQNCVVKPMVSTDAAMELQAQQAKLGVITTMPEGELRTYERTGGQGMYANNDQIGLDVQSGKMDIVFAEDNVVYMKNILFNCRINYGTRWAFRFTTPSTV